MLASELWVVPVPERRLAAVVLLPGQVGTLMVNDLTRIERLLRDARVPEVIEPLAGDVVARPLVRLTGVDAERAQRTVAR